VDTDIEEAMASGLCPESLEALVAPTSKLGPEAQVIEGSNVIDMYDADFVYDHTHFCKYKAYQGSRTTIGGVESLWRDGSW
jgi:hypothetical protein